MLTARTNNHITFKSRTTTGSQCNIHLGSSLNAFNAGLHKKFKKHYQKLLVLQEIFEKLSLINLNNLEKRSTKLKTYIY